MGEEVAGRRWFVIESFSCHSLHGCFYQLTLTRDERGILQKIGVADLRQDGQLILLDTGGAFSREESQYSRQCAVKKSYSLLKVTEVVSPCDAEFASSIMVPLNDNREEPL